MDPDLNCRISLIRGPNLPLFSSVHLYIIFKKSGISFSFSVIPCQVNHYGLHVTDFAEILHTIRDVKKIPEPEDERSDLKLKKNFGAISKNKKSYTHLKYRDSPRNLGNFPEPYLRRRRSQNTLHVVPGFFFISQIVCKISAKCVTCRRP